MRHFGKIPEDSAMTPAMQASATLTELYTFRMRWLNGDVSGDGAPHMADVY
jgi:hypothetical protein